MATSVSPCVTIFCFICSFCDWSPSTCCPKLFIQVQMLSKCPFWGWVGFCTVRIVLFKETFMFAFVTEFEVTKKIFLWFLPWYFVRVFLLATWKLQKIAPWECIWTQSVVRSYILLCDYFILQAIFSFCALAWASYVSPWSFIANLLCDIYCALLQFSCRD